jgi:hypothetical protein
VIGAVGVFFAIVSAPISFAATVFWMSIALVPLFATEGRYLDLIWDKAVAAFIGGCVAAAIDRAAVHHVADRHVGRVPGQAQPHFVGIEHIGHDAELADEGGLRDELRHDVRAALRLAGSRHGSSICGGSITPGVRGNWSVDDQRACSADTGDAHAEALISMREA